MKIGKSTNIGPDAEALESHPVAREAGENASATSLPPAHGCVDFAPLVPRDAGVFYDELHFSEDGAREVVEAPTKCLTENHTL